MNIDILAGLYVIFCRVPLRALREGMSGLRWTGANFAILLVYFFKYLAPVATLGAAWWFALYEVFSHITTHHDHVKHPEDPYVLASIFTILYPLALHWLVKLGKQHRRGELHI